jgi:hypothetical protein
MAAENPQLDLPPARVTQADRSSSWRKTASQNGTFALPNYLNRRGELSLVGPSGLLEESHRVRLDLMPDADRALLLRVTW